MIYYLLVFLAAVGLALQFSTTKLYQTKFGSSVTASMRYTALVGLFGTLIFLAVSGFSPEFTPFSVLCAFLIALLCTVYSLLGFKIMSIGSVSIYTMFLMLGGMLLPYLFGVFFLNEKLSPARILGMLLMIIALILPCLDGKKTGKRQPPLFWALCALVFVLNGFVSIISKLHQVSASFETVPSEKFVILTNGFSLLLSAAVLLIMALIGKKKADKADKAESPSFDKKTLLRLLLIVFVGAAFNGASYFLQLVGAANLPASVLYPMVTGGSIVLTAIAAAVFFKEKPAKPALAGLILAFCATFLFLF